jgi:hypothetical protein
MDDILAAKLPPHALAAWQAYTQQRDDNTRLMANLTQAGDAPVSAATFARTLEAVRKEASLGVTLAMQLSNP